MRWASVMFAFGSGCAQLLGLQEPQVRPDADNTSADAADPGVDAPTSRCGVATLIRNPGFVDATAWQLSGTASVDTAAPGFADLGAGRIENGDGAFAQTTCVVAPASNEGLALGVAVLESGGGGGNSGEVRTSAGAQARTSSSLSSSFAPWTMCLGDSTYDADLTIELAGIDVDNGQSMLFDSLTVAPVPATTCPIPGTVRGGDFETIAAWTSSYYIEGGAGARRLHLRTGSQSPYTCNAASSGGLASIPAAMTSAAIVFEVSGNLPANATFYADASIAGIYIRILSLSVLPSAPQIRVACLPANLRGLVVDLRFGMFETPASTCPTNMNAYIDDVVVMSSASCP